MYHKNDAYPLKDLNRYASYLFSWSFLSDKSPANVAWKEYFFAKNFILNSLDFTSFSAPFSAELSSLNP